VIPVLVIVSLLALVVRLSSGGTLFGMVGFLILGMLPIGLITSRIMWKKGIIKVVDKDEASSQNAEEQTKVG
jgi:F0F1-type ATP synthase assembly protein I